MSARFQQEGKVEVERQRRNSLPRQGASSEAQVLRTAGGIPSGPYAFLVLSSERAEMTSLEEITILGINELEGVEEGGIAPESSKVELEANVLAKSSALVEGKMAVVPSEETRKGGGKRRERGRSKVRVDIFCEMPERARGRRTRKIIAFATEKRVFGISKNRFCTIPG